AEPLDEMVEAERAHGAAALGNEDVGLGGILAAQPAQSTDLIAPDRMDAWCAAFGAANVQPALIKLDLTPHGHGSQGQPTWPSRCNHNPGRLSSWPASFNCEAFDGWRCFFG